MARLTDNAVKLQDKCIYTNHLNKGHGKGELLENYVSNMVSYPAV